MKQKIAGWMVLVLCCLALGIWQRNNLRIIGREYSSLLCHFESTEGGLRPKRHLIKPAVAQADPEATAIAEMILADYEDPERIDFLADQATRHPNSEFILFDLAGRLLQYENTVDPQIPLHLADRLIKLDPENAMYHYLRAAALWRDRTGSDITAVLNEMEYAAQCPRYEFPDQDYVRRAIQIAEKAKLSGILVHRLNEPYFVNTFSYTLRKDLLNQAQAAFSDGDYNLAFRIDDAVHDMIYQQATYGNNLSMGPFYRPGMNTSLFGYWFFPQELELQRAVLSPEKARQNRLELCAFAMATQPNVDRPNQTRQTKTLDSAVYAVGPAIYAGRMLFIHFLIWLLLTILILWRGYIPGKVKWTAIAGYIVISIVYFCLIQSLILSSHQSFLTCCYTVLDPLVFQWLGWDSITDDPEFVRTLLLGSLPVILVLGLILYIFKKFWAPFFTWLHRIFWRILVPIWFLVCLAVLTIGYDYLRYLPLLLFIVIMTLACTLTQFLTPGKSVGMSNATERDCLRSRMWQFTGACMILYGILLVLLASPVARWITIYIQHYAKSISEPYSISLPPADTTTYQQVLQQLDQENLRKMEAGYLLGLIMPEDLPAVLGKLKNREFTAIDELGQWFMFSKTPQDYKKKAEWAKKWQDQDLLHAMQYGGRDTVEVLTGFLSEPESDRALLARAKLADPTIKDKLEILWQSCLSSRSHPETTEPKFWEMGRTNNNRFLHNPIFTRDILIGLACVCKPDEAVQRFTEFIQSDPNELLNRSNILRDGVKLLPSSQAVRVMENYLSAIQNLRNSETETSYHDLTQTLIEELNAYSIFSDCRGDRELAEAFFQIQLQAAERIEFPIELVVSPYFTEESIPLLRKGLASRNEKIRAWSVWQLRKLDYPWEKAEQEKICRDSSWRVRANAVLAGKDGIGIFAKDDKNGLVRLAADFAINPETKKGRSQTNQ